MCRTKLLLLGILTVLTPKSFGQDCARPENVFSFMFLGKKYEIVKELYNWNTASLCAADRGGYLVHINSGEEQDTVFRSILYGAKVSPTYKPVNDGGGTSYVWIGATDKATEGTWLWDGDNDGTGAHFWSGQGLAGSGTGTSVAGLYNNWGGASVNPNNQNRRMEPDNYGSGQDCGAMALTVWPASTGGLGIAGEWNDISGSSALFFVVEYDSSSSIHPEELRQSLNVFPNPASDKLYISSSDYQQPIVSIRISNILGSTVYEKKGMLVLEHTVNLREYPPGLYFLQATFQQGRTERVKVLVR